MLTAEEIRRDRDRGGALSETRSRLHRCAEDRAAASWLGLRREPSRHRRTSRHVRHGPGQCRDVLQPDFSQARGTPRDHGLRQRELLDHGLRAHAGTSARATWNRARRRPRPDNRFTLLPIVCLGCCDHAPAMMVDDDLHSDLNPQKIDRALENYQ